MNSNVKEYSSTHLATDRAEAEDKGIMELITDIIMPSSYRAIVRVADQTNFSSFTASIRSLNVSPLSRAMLITSN